MKIENFEPLKKNLRFLSQLSKDQLYIKPDDGLIHFLSFNNERTIIGDYSFPWKKNPENFSIRLGSLFVEEPRRYIPSGAVKTASKPTIKRVAQEGRKFLMGMGIVSQRPSRLDDDVLSQCNNQIIMRLTNPNDQSYVKKVSEWISESDVEEIRSMAPGEAFIFGSAVPLSLPMRIKKERLTEHGGYTPDIVDELEDF